MLFDTHAHYDAEQFDADRHALLSSMPSLGVDFIMNPGCDIPSSKAALALAEKYPFLYAAVGYHPENCAPYEKGHIEILREMAKNPKVKAIGEIGLDYYWPENPPKDLQAEVSRAQMALAEELSLPVIIHEREAHADALAIVKEFPKVKGVFHFYSGSAEFAKEVLSCGYMISFTGVVTIKNARRAAEA
ncbi:MAG: TatD family hydrolase, partial [Oscillospiraceae bacterium]|nr:TatD family hydrolase [Oscillospiraceae bacterium]